MKHMTQVITMMILSLILIIPSSFAVTFPDVDENASYAQAVEYVSEMGIMEGKGNGEFDPEGGVTRAEMAAIICRILGYETNTLSGQSSFPDCQNHWAERYVAKVAELGIVNGYDDGNFGPGDSVTYEQAVAMIVRTALGDEEASENGGWPSGYLKVAESRGYLEGIYVEVGKNLSRGNVAAMLLNYFNNNY